MPRRFRYLLLATVVVASPQPAAAVNLFFMPGDAFFSASLSEKSAAAMPDAGGTVTLTHHWLTEDMYLCGYAGFAQLEVREVPPEVATGLKSLYRHLRKEGYWKDEVIRTVADGEQIRSETNPFLLLVYDKSFDPRRFEFDLKYNESWADVPDDAVLEGKKFRFEAIKYEKFLAGEEAVILDWKDGPQVPALPVKVPEGVKWASAGAGQHPPAIAKAADLRFFVLPHDSLESLYKAEEFTTFWEVTSDGFRRFDYESVDDTDETELVATDVPFDQLAKLTGWLERGEEEGDAAEPSSQP